MLNRRACEFVFLIIVTFSSETRISALKINKVVSPSCTGDTDNGWLELSLLAKTDEMNAFDFYIIIYFYIISYRCWLQH